MLVDRYQRKFKYLRLSLTDRCNFNCSYCLPTPDSQCGPKNFLNLNEIKNLSKALIDLGVEKIRLTGGEPTLRSDLVDVVNLLKNEIGIPHVALTTNGSFLEHQLIDLKNAGLDSLNVSLDSFNEKKFSEICSSNKFQAVYRSIEKALVLDISSVKLNAVFLKGVNDSETSDVLSFIKTRKVQFRYIELMQTGNNKSYFDKYHQSMEIVRQNLVQNSWKKVEKKELSGPADVYVHHEYQGSFGFISPYHKNFCEGCNRLRISAKGELKLCLFGNGSLSLRDWMQFPGQKSLLQTAIIDSLSSKQMGHQLHQGIIGDTKSLSAIGG